MCGICGIFNFDRQCDVDSRLLQRMMKRIYHRGPDDNGFLTESNIGLGMQRLSIIDLKGGRQPIHNENKTIWVVFNGEIYNYRQLREYLKSKGHHFLTQSDTEVIVHLYEEENEGFVEKLRGMFAIALWDGVGKKLILARDRLGIKPLYYYLNKNKLLFGSEIKTILEWEEFQKEIDFQALDSFFAYTYIPAPYTILKGILKLLPGHMLICTEDNVQMKKYWDLSFEPDYQKAERQIATEFLEIFSDAVQFHLISDVPIGVFLSGGIDSSLVTAFIEGDGHERRSFTVGFGGNIGAYDDERKYAQLVSQRYHTSHEEFEVTPDLSNILDKIVSALDEPLSDDGIIPTYYICKLASQKVKVSLTGLGGDEMFGGYERYLGFRLNHFYSKIPGLVRKRMILPLINILSEPQNSSNSINYLKRFARSSADDQAHTYLSYITTLTQGDRRQLYKGDLLEAIDFSKTEEQMLIYYNSPQANHPMDKVFYQDIKTYLPDDLLNITDKLSMAHSLELRVPFIDHEVVEYCAKIPWQLKLKHLKKKYSLKRLAQDYLPREVIRHKKLGFSSPMSSWLRSDLRSYANENLSDDMLKKHGLLRTEFVRKVLDDHFENRENNNKLIFSLLVLQKWLELYM